MSTYKHDGSVIPSGMPMSEKRYDEHTTMFGLYKGQIMRIVYPEDVNNSNGNRVEYVVRVNGQDYPNCVSVNSNGAIYNKGEKILKPSEKASSGKIGVDTYPENMDGEFVYVLFLQGHGNLPVIVGCADHPKQNFKVKKEDGLIDFNEFNGVQVMIDKDSNYKISHVGNKDKDGKITNDTSVGSYVELYGNGDIELNAGATNDAAGVRAKFSKADKKMEFYAQENKVVYDATGVSIVDKNNNEFKFAATGVSIKSIDKANIESTGDMTIKGAKIDASATGEASLKGTGGTKVGSGGSVTEVQGTQVNLAGGGKPIATVGSQSIGIGNLGAPVISNIVSGSPKVFSP